MGKKVNKARTHEFSYQYPIAYNGNIYPGTDMIVDGQEMPVFASDDGNVYAMVNGAPQRIMYQHNLPGVTVTPSLGQIRNWDQALSNDATANYVNGLIEQRKLNPQLAYNATKGAEGHAAWDKEHSNLAAWRDFASAVPLAVAATPFVAGAGSAAAGTAAGQAVLGALANPGVQLAGEALGIGMGMHGVQDLRQGKFTPMTALDLTGLGPSAFRASKQMANLLTRAVPRIGSGAAARTMEAANNVPRNEFITIEDVDLGLGNDYTDLPFTRSLTYNGANQRYLPHNPRPELPEGYIPSDVNIPQSVRDDAVIRDAEELADMDRYLQDTTFYDDPTPVDPWDTIADSYAPPAPLSASPVAPAPPLETAASVRPASISAPVESSLSPAPHDYNASLAEWEALRPTREAAYQRYTDLYNRLNLGPRAEARTQLQPPPSSVTISPEVASSALAEEAAKSRGVNSARGIGNEGVAVSPGIINPANNPDPNNPFTLKPRTVKQTAKMKEEGIEAEQPYTEEEIRALLNPDGTLRSDVQVEHLYTGAHGGQYRYSSIQDPSETLGRHLFATLSDAGRHEGWSIKSQNPLFGKSGVAVSTHSRDTSIDSTPLAYRFLTSLMADRKFMPITTRSPTVTTNTWGINNYFKPGYRAEMIRAKKLYGNSAEEFLGQYPPELLKDANGDMTAFKLRDAEGEFFLPLRTRDEALDAINGPIHKFNTTFGTNYPDATVLSSRKPWNFGTLFRVPNIKGIFYDKGGNLRRSPMTSL